MRYSDLFEVTQNYDLLRAANSAVYMPRQESPVALALG
jgi:hypothetical protein